MKTTREGDNLPSRSTPIRKGKMSKEQIEATAKELTKCQVIEVVEAPKIEPVVKGDYKAFAASIKSKFQTNDDTVELTGDYMKSLFPQVKCAGDVAKNLKRYYGLSYRRVENGRNDTYVFFIEPTREELTVMLTSAETKVIELENFIRDKQKELTEMYDRRGNNLNELGEENSQLKSDLSNQKIDKLILLGVAILSVISIILK